MYISVGKVGNGKEGISKMKSFTFLLCSVAQIHSYCMCFKKILLLDINHIKKIWRKRRRKQKYFFSHHKV